MKKYYVVSVMKVDCEENEFERCFEFDSFEKCLDELVSMYKDDCRCCNLDFMLNEKYYEYVRRLEEYYFEDEECILKGYIKVVDEKGE